MEVGNSFLKWLVLRLRILRSFSWKIDDVIVFFRELLLRLRWWRFWKLMMECGIMFESVLFCRFR